MRSSGSPVQSCASCAWAVAAANASAYVSGKSDLMRPAARTRCSSGSSATMMSRRSRTVVAAAPSPSATAQDVEDLAEVDPADRRAVPPRATGRRRRRPRLRPRGSATGPTNRGRRSPLASTIGSPLSLQQAVELVPAEAAAQRGATRRADCHVVAVTPEADLVTRFDAELVTKFLGDHHLALRTDLVSHTTEYNWPGASVDARGTTVDAYCAAWSRSTRRRILPEADFGIASTNVTLRICL